MKKRSPILKRMSVNSNHYWKGKGDPQGPTNGRIGDPKIDRKIGVGKTEARGAIPHQMLVLCVERGGTGNKIVPKEDGDQVPRLQTHEGIDRMGVDPRVK